MFIIITHRWLLAHTCFCLLVGKRFVAASLPPAGDAGMFLAESRNGRNDSI